jgi:hypothetical protein
MWEVRKGMIFTGGWYLNIAISDQLDWSPYACECDNSIYFHLFSYNTSRKGLCEGELTQHSYKVKVKGHFHQTGTGMQIKKVGELSYFDGRGGGI